MFLRRYTKRWGGGELPTAMATLIVPGAHDLLAADAGRNGSIHGGRRPSVSLQVTSSDLSVGEADFHVSQEQDHEGRTH
jgi:hypothetical protein